MYVHLVHCVPPFLGPLTRGSLITVVLKMRTDCELPLTCLFFLFQRKREKVRGSMSGGGAEREAENES